MKQLWQQLLNLFKTYKVRDKEISLCFMTEKKVGHGEDAPPILIIKDNYLVVGVFDGMGGAGAVTCNSSFGDEHTQAYVSSRIVSDAMQFFFQNHLLKDDFTEEDMIAVLKSKLLEEKEKYPPVVKSSLRSKLVRQYPTTLAITTLHEYDTYLEVDSYWAGDSHCYLWTNSGFYQISKDDLEEINDPMENLHNDSPISNCVCTDRDFVIHHLPIQLNKEPVVILCATDGCFGYYHTPMHFEHMLKSCLGQSRDAEEWKEKIQNELLKVTADDCSLSLIAYGFSSFDNLKHTIKVNCDNEFTKLVKLEQDVDCAKHMFIEAKERYEKGVADGWRNYKQSYMKYINEEY